MHASAPFFLIATLLAACSGNYSTGTQPNPLPPGGAATPAAATGSATPGTKTASTTTQSSPGPGVYPIADAMTGFACPETAEGYSCLLRFNVPPPTPAPKPRKGNAKVTATPSPSPSPTEAPSGSPAPSTSPTSSASAGPTVTLHAEAQPKAAPQMVHVPKNALNVVALMMVTLTPSVDFPIAGNALAQFTVPKEQIGGRGFALQLFIQRLQGKTKAYAPILSLDKASLNQNRLTFGFTPAGKLTVPKGGTYVLVLYATDISQSPLPSASPAPKSSP